MRSRTMSLILLLGMVLLLIWMPARAQESATLATNTAASEIAPLDATALPVEVTVEPTQEVQPPVVVQPNEDSHLLELVKQALPWIGVVAITFIIMLGTLGHQFIVNLGKSAPVPVREVAISAGSEILKQAEGYVMKTTTPLDDIGLKEVRRLFDQYIAEIRATGQIPLPPTSDQSGQVG